MQLFIYFLPIRISIFLFLFSLDRCTLVSTRLSCRQLALKAFCVCASIADLLLLFTCLASLFKAILCYFSICRGTHQLMHHMDQMMNSMMHDPFQSLMQPMHHHHTGMMQQSPSQHHMHQTRSAMIPFGGLPGFPMPDPFGMGSIFQGFVSQHPN